jgi:PAS domain S-box-containing protein
METLPRDIFASAIAIVNSNRALANILREQCALYGFKHIRIFTDWESLLADLAHHAVDLIISDHLPDWQGMGLSQQLKARSLPAHSLPVVLYTQTAISVAESSLPDGFTLSATLCGRNEQQRLVETVHETLEHQRAVRERERLDRQRCIMVVTEDEPLSENIRAILEKEGYRVHHVGDGKEALRRINTAPPPLVLLDYHISKLSSLSLLSWIQKTYPDTWVMIMGDEDSPELVTSLMQAGVHNYLKKPFDPSILPALCTERYAEMSAAVSSQQRFLESGGTEQQSNELVLLKKSEENFRMLVNASGDIVFRITPHGILNFASPAVEEQLGYTNEDLAEERINIAKFVHAADLIRVMAGIRQVIRGTSIQGLECRLMHKDRVNFRWYSINCYPMYNSQHHFIGVGGIARDIASIKKFEREIRQQNERLSALNEIARIVSQSLDLHEILNDVTDKVLEIIKLQAGGVLLLNPEHGTLHLENWRVASEIPLAPCDFEHAPQIQHDLEQEGLITDIPMVIEDLSQDQKFSNTTLAEMGFQTFVTIPLKSKETPLGVMLLLTQESRKIGGDDLQLLMSIGNQVGMTIENIRLYQKEMGDRERLEELNKLKDDFVAIVSHDLRSPLTAILSAAEILLSDEFMDPPLTDEQKDLVDNIQTMGNHQLNMVNDLLDLAKIESGKIELNPTMADLHTVVEQCLQTLRVLAENKNITLRLVAAPNLPKARFDVPKISQVINNLVGNAIKFTEPNGTIRLRIGAEDQTALQLSVTDTGQGIEPEHLRLLFDKFQQVRSQGTGGERGTGLGLSICKNLIELHQGAIWAESRVGVGSTFTFTLPIQERAVLIIDDSLTVIKSLEAMLAKHLDSVRVDYALHGQAGLKQIEERFPAVLILDYMMPDMDGIVVYRELKNRYGLRVPPTIFLTASEDLEVRRQIFDLGAADYLQKPVEINDLLPRISRFL